MAVTYYNLANTNAIVHETSVVFAKPMINVPIHLMQYDNKLPIIAVELFKDSEPYYLPDINNIYVLFRWGMRDHSFIHKQVLGCDQTRHIVYFAVEEVMVKFNGVIYPIIDIVIKDLLANKLAGSSYITVEIDKNPIQKDDIKSAYILDELVDITTITANPTVTGEEPIMNSIGIGDVNYILPVGTVVIPNPEVIVPSGNILYSIQIDDEDYIFPFATLELKEDAQTTQINGIVFEKINTSEEER